MVIRSAMDLEFNPFLKNSKEIFVSTDESKEVLFQAGLSCKNKGLWTAYRQPRPQEKQPQSGNGYKP